MQSKLKEFFQQYHHLTYQQQQAIAEHDMEELNKLIAEKDSLIEAIKQLLQAVNVPDMDTELKQEIVALQQLEQDNIKKLRELKADVSKSREGLKNRQDALKSYNKNIKS